MVFPAPNLVFVTFVAFNLGFWHLLLLVPYVVLPFTDRFFMVCCVFSPCVWRLILLLYLFGVRQLFEFHGLVVIYTG